jgi:Tfp pilus assembly protein PilV
MRAPTQQVSHKLLTAHKQRSLRMITQFKQSLADAAAVTTFLQNSDKHRNNSSGVSAEAVSAAQSAVTPNGKLDNIANARQFHQNMMVGLIEACKGIIELYATPDAALPTSPLTKASAHRAVSGGCTDCCLLRTLFCDVWLLLNCDVGAGRRLAFSNVGVAAVDAARVVVISSGGTCILSRLPFGTSI